MEDLNIHLEKINPVTVNHLSLPTITLWLNTSPLEYGQTSNIKKTTSSKASPKSSTRFFPESLKAWLKLRCSVLEQIVSQADFDDFGSVGSWPIGLNMLTSMACVEKPRSPGFNSSKQRTSKWEFNWCLVWTDRLTDAGIYEPRLVRSPHPPKRKGVSGLFLEDSVCESKFFRFWHCFFEMLADDFWIFRMRRCKRSFLVASPFSSVTWGRTHFIFAMFSSKWFITPFQIIWYLMNLSHPLFASLVPFILQLLPSTDQTEDRSTGLPQPWRSHSGDVWGNGCCSPAWLT